MPNKYTAEGGKKSLIRQFDDFLDVHFPSRKIFFKFLVRERKNPLFKPKEQTSWITSRDINNSDFAVAATMAMSHFSTPVTDTVKFEDAEKFEKSMEMSPAIENAYIEPIAEEQTVKKIKIKHEILWERKTIHLKSIPKIEIVRPKVKIKIPDIKINMTRLKKWKFAAVIILCLSFVLITIPGMIYGISLLNNLYKDGFISDVRKYELDKHIENQVNPLIGKIDILQEKLDNLSAVKLDKWDSLPRRTVIIRPQALNPRYLKSSTSQTEVKKN